MSNYGVVLFFTTSSAIRSEKVMERENIVTKLIPTPRELSSDCGIALRFGWEYINKVQEALEAAGVETAGIRKIS